MALATAQGALAVFNRSISNVNIADGTEESDGQPRQQWPTECHTHGVVCGSADDNWVGVLGV